MPEITGFHSFNLWHFFDTPGWRKLVGTATCRGMRTPDLSGFQLDGDMKARRIVVAMSGGVDSSVVAGLAAATGAETIGITLQL